MRSPSMRCSLVVGLFSLEVVLPACTVNVNNDKSDSSAGGAANTAGVPTKGGVGSSPAITTPGGAAGSSAQSLSPLGAGTTGVAAAGTSGQSINIAGAANALGVTGGATGNVSAFAGSSNGSGPYAGAASLGLGGFGPGSSPNTKGGVAGTESVAITPPGQAGAAGAASGATILTVPAGTPEVVENFDGALTAAWVPIQAAGGDFAKFARIEAGSLIVDVPAGNSWGKTGVRSKDPVFTVTDDMATTPYSLLVDINPAQTSGFVVVLSPAADDDVWRDTTVWGSYVRHPTGGGTSVSLVNTQNATDTSKTLTNAPLSAPSTVALVARTKQAQLCSSSGWGMEGDFSWLTPGTKVYAYVFAHPYDQHMPAKLAVSSIRVMRGSACGNQNSLPTYTASPSSPVWSDSFTTGVAQNFTPIQAVGGNYASFAKTTTGELFVDVPKDNSWGKTGIRSSYYLFDVRDDFTNYPLAATFTFDPTRTNGYAIVLSSAVDDDIWRDTNVWTTFVRHPTAAGATATLTNTQSTSDTSVNLGNIPSESPASVTLAVRPGNVQLCTSTGWGMQGDYAWLTPGTKLYAYVFSHAYDQGMPTSLALKSIDVTRSAACGAKGGISAYPAPAPRTLFEEHFVSGYATHWAPMQAVGGDFAQFAKVTTNEVYVDVPANNSWGKTGIRSNYYLFDVRKEFATAPLNLEFTFDPTRTTGYRVVLSQAVDDDIWRDTNVWTGYMYDPVNNRGVFDLTNTQSTTDSSQSLTNLPTTAPGTLTLSITPKHVKATMSGGYSLEGDYAWLDVNAKVYVYVFSHPYEQNGTSRMALQSIKATR